MNNQEQELKFTDMLSKMLVDGKDDEVKKILDDIRKKEKKQADARAKLRALFDRNLG